MVDLAFGGEAVGEFGEAGVVADDHQMRIAATELTNGFAQHFGRGEIQALVLHQSGGRHVQLFGKNVCCGECANRGAGDDAVRLELAFTQTPSHLRCVFLAARLQLTIPILLSGVLRFGFGVAEQGEALHSVSLRVQSSPRISTIPSLTRVSYVRTGS